MKMSLGIVNIETETIHSTVARRILQVGYVVTENKGRKFVSEEPKWSSASQEIPRFLWNQKVHYRVNNSP